MNIMKKYALAALFLACTTAHAAPQVVTTIKPVHSLVSMLMQDVGEAKLLISQASPHAYQSKPSDLKAIREADVLVWVSRDLETFVPALLANAEGTQSLEWAQLSGVQRLPNRSLRDMTVDEEEKEHSEHEEHEKHSEHEEHEHHHGEFDVHLWLSMDNAAVLLRETAAALLRLDPEHQALYERNLAHALQRLDALRTSIAAQLKSVEMRPFAVFHDAYQYLEKDFHLNARAVVRLTPEQEPGARHVAQLRAQLQAGDIMCLFQEPQFSSSLAQRLTQGTAVKLATLDPLGADLKPGADAYVLLMQQLADQLTTCLAE